MEYAANTVLVALARNQMVLVKEHGSVDRVHAH